MMGKHRISIDIETYSDLPIGSVGLYRYADSPAFRVLLIAVAVDDGPVVGIDMTKPMDGSRKEVFDAFVGWLQRDDVTLHAYNAVFEWYCLMKAGISTPIEKWRCTMVHGQYLGYSGGLGAMGQAVGIEEDKQKLSIGKALIRRFCTPDKEGNRVSAEQEPEKWGLFEQYNKRDVEAERALLKRFLPWPMPEREQLLWQQDIKMNSAGVCVETRLIDAARMVWADEKSELTDEAMSISGLDNPASVAQLRAWLTAEMGGDEVSVRKEDVKDLLSEPSTPQSVRRMLEIRQRLGKTSVAKYDTLAAMTSSDDDRRVRGLLQFYGAHTGRWSGRGIQVQNLPKPNMNAESLDLMREQMLRDDIDYHTKRQILNLCFGNLPDTLSQLIRTTLIAKEGNTLAVADYSAIDCPPCFFCSLIIFIAVSAAVTGVSNIAASTMSSKPSIAISLMSLIRCLSSVTAAFLMVVTKSG